MTYTALAVGFLIVCAVVGMFGGPRAARPRVAVAAAVVMVAAQYVLLTSR